MESNPVNWNPINWDPHLQHAALTDIGLRRANNQDSMAVVIADNEEIWLQRGHLFIVADGMGAHAAGELASKMATDAISLSYSKLPDLPPAEALARATVDANDQIYQRGTAYPEFRGMGTTCTSLLLLPEGAVVAHVGDSRAYRLRGDRFEQLTFDHSLVWEMKTAGQIPEEAVPDYIPRNIITRSLGPHSEVEVEVEGPFPLVSGDTFLLCSDGLSGQVADAEMAALLETLPPTEAAQALIDLAKLRGGPDNITVVIARVDALEKGELQKTDKSEPSTTSDEHDRPRRHLDRGVRPALWTWLGVALLAAMSLAAGILAAKALYVPASICLIAALVAGIVVIVLYLAPAKPDTEATSPKTPARQAPYTTCTSAVNSTFVAELARVAEELRDAAAKATWSVDLTRFDASVREAQDSEATDNHEAAVRHYATAIRFMLSQLEEKGNEPT